MSPMLEGLAPSWVQRCPPDELALNSARSLLLCYYDTEVPL